VTPQFQEALDEAVRELKRMTLLTDVLNVRIQGFEEQSRIMHRDLYAAREALTQMTRIGVAAVKALD
jgi:hypothetical protein